MHKDPVDILLAAYNGENYVEEQIASIQAQSYDNWRLLVSDDCSTDSTVAIINRLCESDSRIEIISTGVRYGSAKSNFLSLLSKSTASYIMFCDQDDVWLPEKIETTLKAMKELERKHGANSPLLAYCDMRVVDADLNILAESWSKYVRLDPLALEPEHLIVENTAAGCTMLLNAPLRDLAIQEIDDSKIYMHDWWLMIIASGVGAIGYCQHALSLYRQHGKNEVGAQKNSVLKPINSIQLRIRRRVICINQAEYFLSLFGSQIPPDVKRHITLLVEAFSSKSQIQALVRILACRCWRRGIRLKIADLISLNHIVRDNKKAL